MDDAALTGLQGKTRIGHMQLKPVLGPVQLHLWSILRQKNRVPVYYGIAHSTNEQCHTDALPIGPSCPIERSRDEKAEQDPKTKWHTV